MLNPHLRATGVRMAAQRCLRVRRGSSQGHSNYKASIDVLIPLGGIVNSFPSFPNRFVDYAMYRVRLLKYHGITPIIVFDGGPLPAKKGTEVERAA
jgi:hypothetical protein